MAITYTFSLRTMRIIAGTFAALASSSVIVSCGTTSLPALRQSVAPEVLKCPARDVTMVPFQGSTDFARGCGREAMITCVRHPYYGVRCFPMQNLRERAAFDLRCEDKKSLQFVGLDGDGHVVGVRGCGRQATYQYVLVDGQWNWIMNSDSHESK
jgi:hypothetical protein